MTRFVHPLPEVVFEGADEQGVGVVEHLQHRGVRVPEIVVIMILVNKISRR